MSELDEPVMEGMTAINRSTAMIHTDERQIAFAEIEVLYQKVQTMTPL